jgi:hypothetical protein
LRGRHPRGRRRAPDGGTACPGKAIEIVVGQASRDAGRRPERRPP